MISTSKRLPVLTAFTLLLTAPTSQALANVLHSPETLMSNHFRMQAADFQVLAKGILEDAKAELKRDRLIHQQNSRARAEHAISEAEWCQSRANVLEGEFKVAEAEFRIEEIRADERIWALRNQMAQGTWVSGAELAAAHANYWELRHKISDKSLERFTALFDYFNGEYQRIFHLHLVRAASLREKIDFEAMRDKAKANLEMAQTRATQNEKFWKDSLEAWEWLKKSPENSPPHPPRPVPGVVR